MILLGKLKDQIEVEVLYHHYTDRKGTLWVIPACMIDEFYKQKKKYEKDHNIDRM